MISRVKDNQKLCLDIGFGTGDSVKENLINGYTVIGCEIFKPAIFQTLAKLDDKSNVFLFLEFVNDFMKSLPTQIFDKIIMYFPDPWPKYKHRMRRCYNVPNLDLQIFRLLKDDGEFVLASDIKSITNHMVDLFDNPFFTMQLNEYLDYESCPYKTNYCRKGFLAGRNAYDMKVKKNLYKKMKCIIIGGSTASGKSSYALKLADKLNGSIINGDSKQVYNVLPTLTAQPENLSNHYLYGYVDYRETMDMMAWLKDCVCCMKKVLEQGKIPIIVGGTGFYLNALKDGFIEIPEVEYIGKLDDLDNESLYKKALKYDADLSINMHDRYRLIRALNVMIGTGKPYSWWLKQSKKKMIDIEFHSVYISKTKEEVRKSADARLKKMFPKVIDEVENLDPGIKKHIRSIIGVEEILRFLRQEISFDDMKELILIRTMQYAKQQRTWFRNKMKFDEIVF